jgi:uncharacterized protein
VTGDDVELRIGVAELRRRPGTRRHLRRSVPIGGLATSTAATPEGSEGELDVGLESLADGVTVDGVIRFRWVGPCRRCLEPTGATAEAEIHEVFKDRPEGPDLLPIEGDTLDLSAVVRDAVVLALPLAPLCRDDCQGPEPERFPVRPAGEAAPPPDPRWAALAELRFDREGEDPLG